MGANAFSRRLEAIGLDFKYGQFTIFAPGDELLNERASELLTAGHSQETIDDVVLFHVSADGIYGDIFVAHGDTSATMTTADDDDGTAAAAARTHPGRCRKTLHMLDNVANINGNNNDQLLLTGAIKQHTEFGYGYVFGPLPAGVSAAATAPAAKQREHSVTECESGDDNNGNGSISHNIAITGVYQMGPGNYRYEVDAKGSSATEPVAGGKPRVIGNPFRACNGVVYPIEGALLLPTMPEAVPPDTTNDANQATVTLPPIAAPSTGLRPTPVDDSTIPETGMNDEVGMVGTDPPIVDVPPEETTPAPLTISIDVGTGDVGVVPISSSGNIASNTLLLGWSTVLTTGTMTTTAATAAAAVVLSFVLY